MGNCCHEEHLGEHRNLYQKYKGLTLLRGVIQTLFSYLMDDVPIRRYFTNTDMPELKEKMLSFFIVMFGGPAVYTGKS